jgi:hypothetical protein
VKQKETAFTQLAYADATVRRPGLHWRIAAAMALPGVLCAYSLSWLAIARLAPSELYLINDQTMHKRRVPAHEGWSKPLAELFAPAFLVDSSCRPHYWAWTEEIHPWPPPVLLNQLTGHAEGTDQNQE